MAAQNETALATKNTDQQPGSGRTSALTRRTPDISLLANPFDLFWFSPFSLLRRMTGEAGLAGADATTWLPAVEVSESNGNLRVQAELPGLAPEDVKVEIGENEIVIQGERRIEHEENRRGVRRTERQYGVFYRTIPLPETAEPDQARATFRNGVLEIDVPVAQASQRRPVPIETGTQSQPEKQQAEQKPAQEQKAAA